MTEPRTPGEGKIWSAIEELRRVQAVNEGKRDAFEKYQRERNHDVLNSLSAVNGQLTLLRDDMQRQRDDMQKHWIEQNNANKNFFRNGIIFLGGIVAALMAYIWKSKVG